MQQGGQQVNVLEYPYKPKPWVMLAVALLFAVIGIFFAMEALTNERGLVLQRLIHLSPRGATVFYWCLTAACLVFTLAGLAGFASGVLSKRTLRLTGTDISAPRYGWSRAQTVVRLAEITAIGVESIHNQRFLNIDHRGGRLSVCASFLPSKAAFEELHHAIVARARAAGWPSRA
jgi:hypothetical protein